MSDVWELKLISQKGKAWEKIMQQNWKLTHYVIYKNTLNHQAS